MPENNQKFPNIKTSGNKLKSGCSRAKIKLVCICPQIHLYHSREKDCQPQAYRMDKLRENDQHFPKSHDSQLTRSSQVPWFGLNNLAIMWIYIETRKWSNLLKLTDFWWGRNLSVSKLNMFASMWNNQIVWNSKVLKVFFLTIKS